MRYRASFFDHVKDNLPKHREGSLLELIGSHPVLTRLPKDKAPCISPASYPAGARRNNASVDSVGFLMFDFDCVSDEQKAAILGAVSEFSYIFYTTYNHAAKLAAGKGHSFRLAIELTRSVHVTEWARFYSRASAILPLPSDPACKDPSRLYILPYVPSLDGAEVLVHAKGQPLDVDATLGAFLPPSAEQPVVAPDAPLEGGIVRSYAQRLTKSRVPERKNVGELLQKVLVGEAFASPQSRHGVMLTLSKALALDFPDAGAEAIADLFRRSVEVMADATYDPAKRLEDVKRAVEGARAKFWEDKDSAAYGEHQKLRGAIRAAFRGTREHAYSYFEWLRWATEQGTDAEGLKKRLILVHGSSFYVFVNGEYRGPIAGTNQLIAAIGVAFAPAVGIGIELATLPDLPSREEILHQYATPVTRVVASYVEPQSRFDSSTETLYEAVCKPRALVPERSEVVDTFLRKLVATEEEYRSLCTWLKYAYDLDKTHAILMLQGPRGVGKTLLAEGVARYYGIDGCTKGDAAVDAFNGALLVNPFVFLDEGLPRAWQHGSGQQAMRGFISSTSHSINRKGLPRITLLGCPRILIAANDLEAFGTSEMQSLETREASMERILCLRVQNAAKDYLETLPMERRNDLVVKDEIARHVLWLRDHYVAERTLRFTVDTRNTDIQAEIAYKNRFTSAVAEWVLRFLKSTVKALPRSAWFIEDGSLWVQGTAIAEKGNWEQYIDSIRVPGAKSVGMALREIGKEPRQSRRGAWFYRLSPEVLQLAAEITEVCSTEELSAALERSAQEHAHQPVTTPERQLRPGVHNVH